MQTIVVSAVNLRKGGTLKILRQCLEYLSARADVHTIALVHDRALCDYPGIEYVEIPWATRSWAHRLWCEYVTMYGISRKMASQRGGDPVDVWLSLHDTTPRVLAHKQEVYCHTSFPFLKVRARDWVMDPKIPLFAHLTKWAYRMNAGRNSSIIVQQNWFAAALASLLHLPLSIFRVIPPSTAGSEASSAAALDLGRCGRKGTSDPAIEASSLSAYAKAAASPATNQATFLYVSTADCHKNFETLCEASKMLEKEVGQGKFKTVITVAGTENRYAKWLHKKWGDVQSIDFHGLMSKDELMEAYATAQCFVFASRIETWGLPISEYMEANPGGAMLLSDLPYAHETSAGAADVQFFNPDSAEQLAKLMKQKLSI